MLLRTLHCSYGGIPIGAGMLKLSFNDKVGPVHSALGISEEYIITETERETRLQVDKRNLNCQKI